MVSTASLAQPPRVAVHPIAVSGLTANDKRNLEALFDVRLARTAGIRLAGSGGVDDALAQPQGRDCEVRDACLRFLAEQTGSLYAVHARVSADALVTKLSASARVVRVDGMMIREVERSATVNGEVMKAGREVIAALLDGLDLDQLAETVPVHEDPSQPGVSVPMVTASAPSNLRTVLGAVTVGAGGATLIAGAVLAGLSASGRGRLQIDSTGAVPAEQASAASGVAQEMRAASVLIPVGAVATAGGLALLLYRPQSDVVVTAAPSRTGGTVLISGRLP